MRTNLKSLLLASALCASTATSAHAQGKLFTWYNYGPPHNFQASFQVTDEEYAVGWPYNPSLYSTDYPVTPHMVSTFSFSAPDYTSGPSLQLCGYPETTPENYPRIGPEFNDATYNRALYVKSDAIVYSITTPGIESTIRQDGWWIVTTIPEPSAFALFGLGLLALCMKRAASRV